MIAVLIQTVGVDEGPLTVLVGVTVADTDAVDEQEPAVNVTV